ncbi:MAG: NAD(P)-dependent glycerol-3-phosphate dehydrogenase [Spirochaetota bacterium]|nr:NAD(P)-dependent glycerol-3-phosphate dehydrogenase [Spirochaetota bacterium]
MSYNVVVLGAGSWGTALSIVLSQKNNVTLWNVSASTLEDIKNNKENSKYLPGIPVENITVETDLKTAVENKDIIVVVIPSKFCKEIFEKLAFFTTDRQIIVSATKGLELSPLRMMTDLIEECIPNKKGVVALSGPSHAEETSKKMFTCLVASSKDQNINKIVQQCFTTSWTRIYTNDDPIGVEIGAAIKNIIAIAAGIVVSAKLGDNTLAALVTRGITEMTRFGVAIGGKSATFSGLTGIGDLIVTCYSPHSRNRYVGQQIVLGKKVDEIESSMTQIPEGVRAVKQIHQYAKENNISVPIIDSVYAILYSDLSLDDWKKMLIERPLTNENNF